MKERGGGNQTDRPRWAGDGLLEIWGGPELLADLERVQLFGLFGTAHSCAGAGAGARATAPHHRAPTPSHLHFFSHSATGQFFCERTGDKQPADTQSLQAAQVPAITGGGQQAGPGREAKRGRWKLTFALPLPSSSSTQQAASHQPSALPSSSPSLRAALPTCLGID